jgi:hypothetical protein
MFLSAPNPIFLLQNLKKMTLPYCFGAGATVVILKAWIQDGMWQFVGSLVLP